jgi:hypothetical protein
VPEQPPAVPTVTPASGAVAVVPEDADHASAGPAGVAVAALALAAVVAAWVGLTHLGGLVPGVVGRVAADGPQARALAFWALAWGALLPWVATLLVARDGRTPRWRGSRGWARAGVPLVLVPVAAAHVVLALATLGPRGTSPEESVAQVALLLPAHLPAYDVWVGATCGAFTGLIGLVLGVAAAAGALDARAGLLPRAVWWSWLVGWPALLVGVALVVR